MKLIYRKRASEARIEVVRNLGSPLFQAFFRTLLLGKAFSNCIKDGKNIEPCCELGKSLLEISIFPFAECTLYAHPQVSVCRVQGVIRLYAPQTGLFLFTLQTAENKKSRQKALLPRPSDDYRAQNKNASIVSILTFLYGRGEEI